MIHRPASTYDRRLDVNLATGRHDRVNGGVAGFPRNARLRIWTGDVICDFTGCRFRRLVGVDV